MKAGSLEEVEQALEAAGWFVVDIEPVEIKRRPKRHLKEALEAMTLQKASGSDITFFFRQMASSIRAGVSISKALDIYAKGSKNTLKIVLRDVLERLENGMGLAEAMAQHPAIFRPLFVEIIHAGELSGTAAEAFDRCARYLQSEVSIKQKIRGALVYPFMVLLLGIGAAIYLVVAVLPKMLEMLISMNVPLPALTKALIGVVGFMTHKWPMLLIGIAVLMSVSMAILRLRPVRRVLDRVFLRLPVFGPIGRLTASARFARVLAETLNSGLPVKTALEMAIKATGNHWMEEKLEEGAVKILSGEDLASAIGSARVLPPMMSQVLRVAQESGSIGASLGELAGFYEEEADTKIKAALSLLEPALIITIAAGVGTLAAAVILPMYTMMGKIGS